jgi:hypothetical protein
VTAAFDQGGDKFKTMIRATVAETLEKQFNY